MNNRNGHINYWKSVFDIYPQLPYILNIWCNDLKKQKEHQILEVCDAVVLEKFYILHIYLLCAVVNVWMSCV